MFECFVDVYIFIFNQSTKKLNIVSLSKNQLTIPSINLDKQIHKTVDCAIKEILGDYVITNSSQINPRLFDVSIINETIRVSYVTSSPIDLRIVDAYYIDVETLSSYNDILRKAIFYV